jgi:mannitol-1-phosphate 5-dehydrogenase
MGLTGKRTFVGFGFGAIQAGLFLYEAFQSGNFGRLVVAEVVPDVVAAIRAANGFYSVNIAHADHIEQAHVGPIEILNPSDPIDRALLVKAIADANEMSTAVPGVNFYVSQGEGSLHKVLAEGLARKIKRHGPRAAIYAAENNNRAAEILAEAVLPLLTEKERDDLPSLVCFADTVIGKMSGVAGNAAENVERGLVTVTPASARAFLVEAFNRILISRLNFTKRPGQQPFKRGITVFEEKNDLLPFEEAKLYGHNATHALAAYLAASRGLGYIAELTTLPGLMSFLRDAFVLESGEALIKRRRGVDALFTTAGYAAYADDLLLRMVNPFLHDSVERVGRDPQRKLGWDDRLIGTMRVAMQQGITPRRYALGAAAALALLHPELRTQPGADIGPLLAPLWGETVAAAAERQAVLDLIAAGLRTLRAWEAQGFPDLQTFAG